jgi:thioredoxin reductase (NADPH)
VINDKSMETRNVVILGSGPAGLTAAIYTARAGLSPLVLEGSQPGGQLTITTAVENFPGFRSGVLGPALIEEMREQALHVGAEIRRDQAVKVDLAVWPFSIDTEEGSIRARTLIIATGASAKWLGLPEESLGEGGLYGKGLSACATCDGFFFRGKQVVVVGGGDTALEEATFLARLAEKVYVVHRRDAFRASKAMQERTFNTPNIEILWNKVVTRIHDPAEGRVTGVTLKDTKTGETSVLPVDGVFVAIGHQPNTVLFAGLLEMDENGYLRTFGGTRTSVPGVFAAGDVADPVYRQAITAAGSGCMAAIDAERWLGEQDAVSG